jgi:hypothetical protein
MDMSTKEDFSFHVSSKDLCSLGSDAFQPHCAQRRLATPSQFLHLKKETTMDMNRVKRGLRISAIVVILSAGTLSRLSGIEDVRLIEFVTILVCGVGIGVFVTNLRLYFKLRKTQ